MPLVSAKCTNCGANLEVDNSKDAAICPYCGSSYIVEKAINNYNVTNNIHANVVNVYGTDNPDFVIRAGKLEKYNGASVDVVIPDNVTEIGEKAFYQLENLRSVVISKGVTKIGKNAFGLCRKLEKVVIPNSVKTIGEYAFFSNAFSTITIPESVKEIGKSAFFGCDELKSIAIPDSVKIIGSDAFYCCSTLSSIKLSNNISEINDGVFAECVKLKTITIPNNVTSIGEHAFEQCEELTSITIPDGVTEIGEYAFCSCTALASITIPDSVETIGALAFQNCPRLSGEDSIIASEAWKEMHYNDIAYLESDGTKKSGCYVATAVYGSYDCPQVWTLRRFRDFTLAKTWYGRAFIRTYYAISPTLVKWFGQTDWFKNLWKPTLDKMVAKLNDEGVADTPYQDRSW